MTDKKLTIADDEKRRVPTIIYSRIVGYLRPVSQWNEGKAQEFKERKEFKIKELESKIKTNNLKLKI